MSLTDTVDMPLVGWGSGHITGDENVFNVLVNVLDSGYRLVDTADAYNNHKSIGKALKV